MAGQRIDIMDLRGLIQLKGKGLSNRKVAEALDTSRYEQLSSYFPKFTKELRKTGCTLQVLWGRYLEAYPDDYRYTQFVHHFNEWKGKTTASGILRHQAGRKLFIDFAGKTLSWVDRDTGEVHQAQVFVALPPRSRRSPGGLPNYC